MESQIAALAMVADTHQQLPAARALQILAAAVAAAVQEMHLAVQAAMESQSLRSTS